VIARVPLALLGLVWALVMTGLTLPWVWRAARPALDRARLGLAAAGALMVVYLVYVELFRIGAVCLWCTAMHLTVVLLFGVVLASGARGRIPADRVTEVTQGGSATSRTAGKPFRLY
jgi:uncharacterized membrane protein